MGVYSRYFDIVLALQVLDALRVYTRGSTVYPKPLSGVEN